MLDNVELVIKGKRDQIATSLVCLFAEGHLLLEDVPGTGKTTLAKAIAISMHCVVAARAVHARPAARPTSPAA